MLGCKNFVFGGLLRSVKCRKVSTRTTLPNFIDLSAETALYSRFSGHSGGVVEGEKRKRTSSI
jgi:hypothetical protein